MKLPKCRLCQHEHGLSEPHVFTTSYSSDDGAALKRFTSSPVGPKTRRRELRDTALETVEIEAPDDILNQSGGETPRRAKASGPDKVLPEKTADEAVPPLHTQAQSVEPSQPTRKDSIAALREVLTKDLKPAEKRALNDLITKLEKRRQVKSASMQRYRAGLKKRKVT